jgi:hypothetical protein
MKLLILVSTKPAAGHSAGKPAIELNVEKRIFMLNGDVNSPLARAETLVFGANKKQCCKQRGAEPILRSPARAQRSCATTICIEP